MRPDLERITGGLLGGAVGDALGWPMEDRGNRVGGTARVTPEWKLVAWKRREGGSYGPHEQPVDAGSVSDDTQLALAVARSVLHGENWWTYFTDLELPLWTLYERGGGGATKRAARAWLRSRAPWDKAEKPEAVQKYFNAGGNGAAMRCLAHCIIADDWEQLRGRLDHDAAATHGHPRAILGSRVYGWCAQWALHRNGSLRYGELLDRVIEARPEWATPPQLPGPWRDAAERSLGDYEREWQHVVDEVTASLEIAKAGIHEGAVAVDGPVLEELGAFGRAAGAGTVTAVAAVFLATRYLSQPQQGLMSAAFARGADTDTLAAMAGGLLGLLTGDSWLSSVAPHVQDYEYTREVARQLQLRQRPEPVAWRFTSRERSRFYRWLDQARPDDEAELPPFGHFRVTEVVDYQPRAQFVRAWKLETDLGQSLLIKRYDKGRDQQPRWVPLDRAMHPTTDAPDRPSEASAEQPDDPRVGLVLRVADVGRATDFYTRVVGLTVRRATERYVSFGWLALEPDERADQLTLAPDREAGTPAIRVYVPADRLSIIRTRFIDFGLDTTPLEHRGQAGFRSSDPDGHPIEVLARNGTNPQPQ